MPPTSSTVNLSRRAAVLIAPFAGGALASAIAFLLLRDSFPDRVPTHFSLDGTPDRFSSSAVALGQYMLVFAIEAIGTLAAGWSAKSALTSLRSLCVFACGLATATAYLFSAGMWTASGSEDSLMTFSLIQLPLAIVVGAAAWYLSRSRA
ncbi:DUF1648 domain-containing protein [Streptomyces sp. NPDC015680]|uniref:DUF1648 domain-containing protein n=1 Tax=Streptomyces sp. NPDC015680 TaxID=3364962 RepID=UPI0036F55E5B